MSMNANEKMLTGNADAYTLCSFPDADSDAT